MSRRNFILFIIILILILLGVFAYLYFFASPSPSGTVDEPGFLSRFNPFGSSTKTPAPSTPTGETPTTEQPTTEIPSGIIPLLRKVSTMPIAGYTSYYKERLKEVAPTTTSTPTAPVVEFMTALRYVARSNGNVHQTFADIIGEQQFTTNTIPKIYEAYFSKNSSKVIMRYLRPDGATITTFLGNVPGDTLGGDTAALNEVKGTFLTNNITDLSLSPDHTKAFYLFDVGENTVGNIINFADEKKTQVFTSAFNEWLSFWPSASTITLTTKPASSVLGYMYTLNTSSGDLNQTLGSIRGLTTLASPDAKLVLYGDNTGALYIYHTDTRVSEPLSLRGLPEKCVWSKFNSVVYCAVPRTIVSSTLPEMWYQGEVSFSDQIWKADLVTGNTSLVVDPLNITGGEDFDGIKLSLDEKENYLFFVNKKDSYLWEYEITPPTPLSSVPQATTITPSAPAPTNNATSTPTTSTVSKPATTTKTTTTKTVAKPKTHNISIANFRYSTASLTINRGDSVVWTNKDVTPHTVTGDNGGPNSKFLYTNSVYKYTFTKAGTYKYHCFLHPNMVATVVVK